MRAAAIFALGERAAPAGVVPLLFALGDPSEYLARLATDALIHIGAPAVPGLVRALAQDAQPRVRANAARALALIGDTSTIPALFKALEDESALVRALARIVSAPDDPDHLRLGRTARERAISTYSWSAIADAYEKLFLDLTSEARRRR